MPNRPNILVFFTDDHGPWAANCCGTRVVRSPSLDRLAAGGARLTRAFTPCPVCSPARASFFTGRFPSQHGIHDYIAGDELPPGHPGLTGQITISQLLRAAGYQTGLIGKWHCGDCRTPQPGFDRWFSYFETQYPHRGPITFSDQGSPLPFDGYHTEAFTEQALRFLRERDTDRPFFLFVGYVDTHTPYEGHPPRLVDPYRAADLSEIPAEPLAACHGTPYVTWPEDEPTRREYLAQYLAAVTMIDEQVGRLLGALEDLDLARDTLVVYTADHGHNNGHHGIHCKGNATTPQNFLEESILVPSLWWWPGVIPSGQVLDPMFDHCDLFVTILDAAGVEVPADINSPGRSMLPVMRGDAATDWKRYQVCEYGNARCIRNDRFKLIRRWPGPNGHFPDELYDLETDPRETENVIDDPGHQSVVARLSAELDAHFARYEVEEVSGIRVAEQPSVNPYEPWRREVHA